MILTWSTTVTLFSIAIIAFVTTLLLKSERKSTSDNLLAAFLILLGFILVNEILLDIKFFSTYALTFLPSFRFLGFLLPVILYLYTNYLLNDSNKFRKKDYYHFFPITVIVVYFLLFSVFSSEIPNYSKRIEYSIARYFGDLIRIVYLILTFREIKRSKKFLLENYSDPEISKISVLRNIILTWVFILVSYQVVIYGYRTGYYEIHFSSAILSTFNLVTVYILGVWGVATPQIVNFKKRNNFEEKYRNSGVQEETKSDLVKELYTYLNLEKPYLDPELNIQEVANSLDISKHQLSEIINSELQKNFFDLINEYRINDFIEKLKTDDGKNFTLLSLAYDSGFNSKSSFYRVFKNITGKTPTQYKKDENI